MRNECVIYTTIPSYLAVSCRLAWGSRGKRDRRCFYHYLLWQLLRLSRSCPCALHMEYGGAWASTQAWTPLSKPLAAVFGPCMDAVAEELAAGRGLVSAVFGLGPQAVAARREPPPTDFLTLSSLSPTYSTPWQLPHLLLLQPSYARPSYARSWSPIYHLRL